MICGSECNFIVYRNFRLTTVSTCNITDSPTVLVIFLKISMQLFMWTDSMHALKQNLHALSMAKLLAHERLL